MLLSISIGNGLQNTIKNKVSSFFGHVLITNFKNNNSESSLDPILIKEDLEKVFELNNIKSLQYAIERATKEKERLGSNAKNKTKNNYSMKQMIENYKNVYEL